MIPVLIVLGTMLPFLGNTQRQVWVPSRTWRHWSGSKFPSSSHITSVSVVLLVMHGPVTNNKGKYERHLICMLASTCSYVWLTKSITRIIMQFQTCYHGTSLSITRSHAAEAISTGFNISTSLDGEGTQPVLSSFNTCKEVTIILVQLLSEFIVIVILVPIIQVSWIITFTYLSITRPFLR